VKTFEDEPSYLGKSLKILNDSLPHGMDGKLIIAIVRELFLKPYLTSRQLSVKLLVSNEDLKSAYFFIRSCEEIRDLFEFSPYSYIIKTLEDLTKDGDRTARIIRGQTPSPLSKTMELFISASCNARCEFCYRNGKVYDKKPMATWQFLDLIDQFADLKGENLDVSGGLEPLLSPSIMEILRRALDRKLRVTLYTNGIALDKPELLEYLLRIDRIRVSLNAVDKESYRRIMGVDKFDVVKDNLANLIERKRDANSIGMSFVVFKKNYRQIPDAVRLAQQLGIGFLDLRVVHVTDIGGFGQRQRDELKAILEQVRREILLGTYGRLRISIADTFNFLDPDSDLLRNLKRDFAHELTNFRVTVAPHGKVYALNVIAQPTREDPRYLLGDFSENSSLLSILRNKKNIPFEPRLFLPHDISLIVALPKLKSDFDFGIDLDESPFNFKQASNHRKDE
jgi:MoaA/NifB/PqqE/SkfB family radical SAM enzyme